MLGSSQMGLCDGVHSEAASPVSSPGTEGPEAMAAAHFVEVSDDDNVKLTLNNVVESTLATMREDYKDLIDKTNTLSNSKLKDLQGLSTAVGKDLCNQTNKLAGLKDALECNTRRYEEAQIIHAKAQAATRKAREEEGKALEELSHIGEHLAELGKRLKDVDFKEKSLAEQMSQFKKSMEVEKAACENHITKLKNGLTAQEDKYLEGLRRAAEATTPPRFTTMHLVMCTGVSAVAAIGLDRFFKH